MPSGDQPGAPGPCGLPSATRTRRSDPSAFTTMIRSRSLRSHSHRRRAASHPATTKVLVDGSIRVDRGEFPGASSTTETLGRRDRDSVPSGDHDSAAISCVGRDACSFIRCWIEQHELWGARAFGHERELFRRGGPGPGPSIHPLPEDVTRTGGPSAPTTQSPPGPGGVGATAAAAFAARFVGDPTSFGGEGGTSFGRATSGKYATIGTSEQRRADVLSPGPWRPGSRRRPRPGAPRPPEGSAFLSCLRVGSRRGPEYR